MSTKTKQPKPVAWRHDNGPFARIAITHSKKVADHWVGLGWDVTPLYEAQPAQAPQVVGYFLRYRVEWHNPSEWSAWAEIDEATYDNAVEIIATGEADAGRFYEARILYDAPPAPVVPDGFKLVPTVPTPEMIAAAMNCDDVTFTNPETFCVNFGNIYVAMLAAAPEGRSND
ncbi:hypothetical protein VRU30_001390 [Serratia marcescens]|nr:hypothetical protein [Serratia marcescens]